MWDIPDHVENEICAKYSSKFRSMNTQLTQNGQEISGYWFLDAYRRSRLNGDADFWVMISGCWSE